eukprot:ANDGO_06031.mRNA.1 Hybrid signal transduction histidine kinase B
MNGSIVVDSSIGAGSEFIIRIPLRLPVGKPVRTLRDDYLVLHNKIGWLRGNYPIVLVLAGSFFDTIAWVLRFLGFEVFQCIGLPSLRNRLQYERKYLILLEDESLCHDLQSMSETLQCLQIVKESAWRNSYVVRIRSQHTSKIADRENNSGALGSMQDSCASFTDSESSSSSSYAASSIASPSLGSVSSNATSSSKSLSSKSGSGNAFSDGISFSEDLLPLVEARFDESILRVGAVAAGMFEKVGRFSDALKMCKTYTIFKPLACKPLEDTLMAIQNDGIHNMTLSVHIDTGAGYHDPTSVDSPTVVIELPACALIAEDNPLNARVLAKHLSKLEWEYDVACDGSEALQLFTDSPEKYSAILMDCFMPEMDGFEATTKIRQEEKLISETHHIPIIAVTADVLYETRKRCFEVGMDDFLCKPVHKETLGAVLKKHKLKR